jgi:hypothetical protein
MKANTLKAKLAGVDPAKKTFWSKVMGVAVAGLAVAAFVALNVATGGAPLIAGAVIGGVVFAVAVADASCAYAASRKPPRELPMGADSIGNLVHWALKAGGASDGKARAGAELSSGLMRVGMNAALACLTLGASSAVDSLQTVGMAVPERIQPLIGGASNILKAVVEAMPKREWAEDPPGKANEAGQKANTGNPDEVPTEGLPLAGFLGPDRD